MGLRTPALILLLAGCQEPQCYPESGLSNFTNYPTPAESDPTLQPVLDAVVRCLEPLNRHWLTPEEATTAECLGPRHIEARACIRLAVVPEWHWNCDGTEQVFSCSVGPQRCLEKGQVPTPACPCSCRAQIQDNTTVWTAPNQKLLAAYIVTLLTGCLSPWTPTLAPCSNIRP